MAPEASFLQQEHNTSGDSVCSNHQHKNNSKQTCSPMARLSVLVSDITQSCSKQQHPLAFWTVLAVKQNHWFSSWHVTFTIDPQQFQLMSMNDVSTPFFILLPCCFIASPITGDDANKGTPPGPNT